jgi:hypothetical protein
LGGGGDEAAAPDAGAKGEHRQQPENILKFNNYSKRCQCEKDYELRKKQGGLTAVVTVNYELELISQRTLGTYFRQHLLRTEKTREKP